jgi:hypothetical protein
MTNTQQSYRRAEMLPNGFVRVECTSGLVRLYERGLGDIPVRRSGQGIVRRDEISAVKALFAR